MAVTAGEQLARNLAATGGVEAQLAMGRDKITMADAAQRYGLQQQQLQQQMQAQQLRDQLARERMDLQRQQMALGSDLDRERLAFQKSQWGDRLGFMQQGADLDRQRFMADQDALAAEQAAAADWLSSMSMLRESDDEFWNSLSNDPNIQFLEKQAQIYPERAAYYMEQMKDYTEGRRKTWEEQREAGTGLEFAGTSFKASDATERAKFYNSLGFDIPTSRKMSINAIRVAEGSWKKDEETGEFFKTAGTPPFPELWEIQQQIGGVPSVEPAGGDAGRPEDVLDQGVESELEKALNIYAPVEEDLQIPEEGMSVYEAIGKTTGPYKMIFSTIQNLGSAITGNIIPAAEWYNEAAPIVDTAKGQVERALANSPRFATTEREAIIERVAAFNRNILKGPAQAQQEIEALDDYLMQLRSEYLDFSESSSVRARDRAQYRGKVRDMDVLRKMLFGVEPGEIFKP